MSFLAPLFLGGLAAVALPVWLHLLQTQTPERQQFSSAMLLQMSEQRVHLRRRLRHLLLLALRIALLVLLALAFAQPLWERSTLLAANDGARLHLIVLDTSLSMGQTTAAGSAFARALAEARTILEGLGANDQAQLIGASDTLELLGSTAPPPQDGARAAVVSASADGGDAAADRAALLQRLDGLTPGAGRLDLGAAMAGVGEFAMPGVLPITLHVISDFQSSGLPAQFGALIPRALRDRQQEVVLHPVGGMATANYAVEYVRRTPAGLDVGVRGLHNESGEVTVALSLNDAREERQNRSVTPGGVAEYAFALPAVAFATGDNRLVATLSVADAAQDGLPGDDRRYLVVPNTPAEPVPLLTARPDAPLVRYLSTAFATAAQQFRIEPIDLAKFDVRTLQRYPWVAIDDLGVLTTAQAEALRAYLEGGGGVLAAAGERTQGAATLPISGQRIQQSDSEAQNLRGQPLGIGRIEASHPLLAATDGWRGVSVTRAVTVETGNEDNVLLALEDGRPLLIDRALGTGHLLILTSSLDNTWNDLPVSPVFVSFIAETARYLSGEQALSRQQVAGASLPLSLTGTASGQVVDPQGQTVLSLADTRRATDVRLRQTGFYQVYTPGKETLVAVNADPRESDLEPMTAEQLDRWRQAAVVPAQQAANTAEPARPPPFELWRLLLIALAVIVLAESLWSSRYLRGDSLERATP